MMLNLQPDERGVILPVRARAGARRNEIRGEREGALVVAVTAAPEKGKANEAITRLLSDVLGVARSEVVLLSGQTSPNKRFLIVGAQADAVRGACMRAIESQGEC